MEPGAALAEFGPRLRFRLHPQLIGQQPATGLILGQGGPPLLLVGQQAHHLAVSALPPGVQLYPSPRMVKGPLHLPLRPVPLAQVMRGLNGQALETLLDDVIELTGADRGVVLLVDPGDGDDSPPRIRVSRNVQREAIALASFEPGSDIGGSR